MTRNRASAYTLFVPIRTMGKHPLSLNSRAHFMVKAKETKKWREFARAAATEWEAMPACDVTLTWFVTDARRRDEDNLYPLLKALCDGLVDAGVVRDDTADLMGKRCRIERAPEGSTAAHMELRVEARLLQGGVQ